MSILSKKPAYRPSKSLGKSKAAHLVEERNSNCSAGVPERESENVASTDNPWDAPFDLEGFPTDLRERLIMLAPCLLGRAVAVYDQVFFHKVVGLCIERCLPKEVTEKMVPTD